MIYVLLAIGLSLIFGLMTVVNFAHGALYMLGAYLGVFVLTYTKSFWVALIVAPLMVGALGLLMERFLIRRLYGRSPDDPLLLTFGLSLILVEGVKVIWGKIGLTLAPPPRGSGEPGLHVVPRLPPVPDRGDGGGPDRPLSLPRAHQHRPHHPRRLARSPHGARPRHRPLAGVAGGLRHRHRAGRPGRHPRRPHARGLRGDGRHDGDRVLRGHRGGRHGQPAGRGGGGPAHRPGGGSHHPLPAQGGRDHGVRRHGRRPAGAAE